MKDTTFRTYSLSIMLCSLATIVLGAILMEERDTRFYGNFLLVVGIVCFAVSFQYLLAKEAKYIAEQKGYFDRAYFWYPFLMGLFGLLLVIGLPNKTPIRIVREEAPEVKTAPQVKRVAAPQPQATKPQAAPKPEAAKPQAAPQPKVVFEKKEGAPYWCGKCGKAGPFEGSCCPNCGSSIRDYKGEQG